MPDICEIDMFAGDIHLFYQFPPGVGNASDSINADLQSWCNSCGLMLIAAKSKHLLIGSPYELEHAGVVDICIGGEM